jgi:hypothetical protein
VKAYLFSPLGKRRPFKWLCNAFARAGEMVFPRQLE